MSECVFRRRAEIFLKSILKVIFVLIVFVTFLDEPEHGPSVDCLSVSPQASLGKSRLK